MKNLIHNDETMQWVADMGKAYSDVNRIRIICELWYGEKSVSDLADDLDIPQNLVSHHLKKLYELQFIEKKKIGTRVYYSLERKKIKNALLKIHGCLRTKKVQP